MAIGVKMTEQWVITTAQLIGTFVTGIFLTWLTIRARKSKIIIEYFVSSMPLLRFKATRDRSLVV